jgi:hypothetical protein
LLASLRPTYGRYELVVLEMRRAVDNGNIYRGGRCPVHMRVGFASNL